MSIHTYQYASLVVLEEQGELCFHAPVCISPLLSLWVLVRATRWVEKGGKLAALLSNSASVLSVHPADHLAGAAEVTVLIQSQGIEWVRTSHDDVLHRSEGPFPSLRSALGLSERRSVAQSFF